MTQMRYVVLRTHISICQRRILRAITIEGFWFACQERNWPESNTPCRRSTCKHTCMSIPLGITGEIRGI